MRNWHKEWIKEAERVATMSKDRSTKVGAVIVSKDQNIITIGYNGFPRGVDDERSEWHERPTKYSVVVHAELNAIINAARKGDPTKGATLYFNYQPIPCSGCTGAIIQAGIDTIVGPDIPFPGKGEQWKNDLQIAQEMINQVGIKQITINI